MSIYVPVWRSGSPLFQGRALLGSLLNNAKNQLIGRGLAEQEASAFLEEGFAVADDVGSWNAGLDGVALFISHDSFHAIHLPFRCEESVHVGDRFYLRPLFAGTQGPSKFFVLALANRFVRMVECGPRGVVEIGLQNIPLGTPQQRVIAHLEKPLATEAAVQIHAKSSGTISPVENISDWSPALNQPLEVEDFSLSVAIAVEARLSTDGDPIILVGSEADQESFRDVTILKNLLPRGVAVDPTPLEAGELRTAAEPLFGQYCKSVRLKAIRQYEFLDGTGHTSTEIEKILPAAIEGRVEIVFAYENSEIWGRLNQTGEKIWVDKQRLPFDEELINRAAVESVRNGGKFFRVSAQEMCLPGSIAAVFR